MPKPCEKPLEDLVAYIEGTLQGSAREELARHLQSGCPRCRENLDWLTQVLQVMQGDRSTPPPAEVIAQAKALYRAPTSGQVEGQWQPIESERAATAQRNWVRLGILIALAIVIIEGLYALNALRLRPSTGVVAALERGSLQVQVGDAGPSVAARVGQVIYPHSRLRSAPDTVAMIKFFDGSAMRIESAGEWSLRQVQGSRQGYLVQVMLGQERGRASYVPAPILPRLYSLYRIEVAGTLVDLDGVCTITATSDGVAQITILQGHVTLRAAGQKVVASAGQEVNLASGQLPVVR